MELLIDVDDSMFRPLHQLIDIPDDTEKSFNNAPTRAYVRDRKAMRNTPADVRDLPNSIVFTVDMPGVKHSDIKVQVEDGNFLVISGERKRCGGDDDDDDEKDKDVKYLRMERRMGKFMRRFPLNNDNVKLDGITATYHDGVLTVTVKKRPPPAPKSIEVKVA